MFEIAYYIHLKIPVLLKEYLKDEGGCTDCPDDDPCKVYDIFLNFQYSRGDPHCKDLIILKKQQKEHGNLVYDIAGGNSELQN